MGKNRRDRTVPTDKGVLCETDANTRGGPLRWSKSNNYTKMDQPL